MPQPRCAADPMSSSAARSSWNGQLPSGMNLTRYASQERRAVVPRVDREWQQRTLRSAPLWASVDLRDGNQALPVPMDIPRKLRLFEELVSLGFKDIEIGYPSSGETDFRFVRELIERDLVPSDVRIGVFTPARPELITRTLESVRGGRDVLIHLCNATACLWRETVFGLSASEMIDMAVESARLIVRGAADLPIGSVRFEYSPETFNVTEPEVALEVCNRVVEVFGATSGEPVIINLPTTVETDLPTVFADQVEWMHTSLDRRDAVLLSVHTHNDRGTAVASTELALLAGADRVEGTLFGNGERTGNVCIPTVALNLLRSSRPSVPNDSGTA